MPLDIMLIVLLAAFLHAFWNALAKQNRDKHMAIYAVVLGHIPFALVAIFMAPTPNWASLPYIIAGAALHTGYQLSLMRAYEHGDLSSVYPISRGLAPVLAALALYLFFGETLSYVQSCSLLLICIGVLSFIFVGQQFGQINHHGIKASLFTAIFIASYSVIDGIGARISETSFGFYGYLSVLNAILFSLFNKLTSTLKLKETMATQKKAFLLGGSASFTAYALVTWAFTLAPIALVAAVRETSIVIALIIGGVFLKEHIQFKKIISAFVTLSGVILLRITK